MFIHSSILKVVTKKACKNGRINLNKNEHCDDLGSASTQGCDINCQIEIGF